MVQNIRQSRFFRPTLLIVGVVTIAFLVIYVPIRRNKAVFHQGKTLSIEEYRQRGSRALSERDWNAAISNYQGILGFDKADPEALERLPMLYIEIKDGAKALEYAQKLADIYPQSPLGYFYLGILDNIAGQYDAAVENFKKAVEKDPQYAEAYFNLGFLSESQGRLSEAIDFYQKTLAANPKHARAAYNLGNAYAGLERFEEAIQAYRNAVAADPNYTDALINLSILLTKTGSLGEAIRYLDEARMLGYEAPAEYLRTLEPYRKESIPKQ